MKIMARLFVLVLCCGCTCAAETLVTNSSAAVEQAQAALAATRTRIADEHAALLREMQAAVAAANSARERLLKAGDEAANAKALYTARLTEHKRDEATLRLLVDRAVIAAKLPEPTVQSLREKNADARIEAAIAGITARLTALPGKLQSSIATEDIITRTGSHQQVTVMRLGQARAVALGSTNNERGLLLPTADGQGWVITGPALPHHVIANGNTIALDASGKVALQPEPVHRSLGEWLAAGRFFIWPIIAVLIIGLGIAGERCFTLWRRRVDPRRLLTVANLLAHGQITAAKDLVHGGTSPLDRVLATGINAHGRPRDAREAAVEQALLHETAAFTRGLPAIAVLAGVAPLLGLLGTVTGMIDMFAVIAVHGSGQAKSLSGGISEALICTQAGMLVAIPLLLLHAWLARLADRRSQILEEAACGVLGMTEHGETQTPQPPTGNVVPA